MHLSLSLRQHWKLVVGADALAAGFLLSAPAAALAFLGAGLALAGAGRLLRPAALGACAGQDGRLGDFGYIEGDSAPLPRGNGALEGIPCG